MQPQKGNPHPYLEELYSWYKEHLEDLLENYEGKWLYISWDKAIGVYDNYVDAYDNACVIYCLGNFIMVQCLPDTEEYWPKIYIPSDVE